MSKMKVWVVANSRFEWYEILHICATKEIALKYFEKLREDLIKDNEEMVAHTTEREERWNRGYHDKTWEDNIDKLKTLIPGETCDCDSWPDLKEWEVEE